MPSMRFYRIIAQCPFFVYNVLTIKVVAYFKRLKILFDS